MPLLTGYHEVYDKRQTYDRLSRFIPTVSPSYDFAIPFGTLAHVVLIDKCKIMEPLKRLCQDACQHFQERTFLERPTLLMTFTPFISLTIRQPLQTFRWTQTLLLWLFSQWSSRSSLQPCWQKCGRSCSGSPTPGCCPAAGRCPCTRCRS